LVAKDIRVPLEKNWIDPYEKYSTQDAVIFFGRLVRAESTGYWVLLRATLEYKKSQAYATAKEDQE
jgi:hypothetical protein